MITEYKMYANDLYDIKLSVAAKPIVETTLSLNVFLDKINILRPVLRLELNQLSKEYKFANFGITNIETDEITAVNTKIINKLQVVAKQISKKIRLLSL